MIVSWNWLKEYVQADASREEIERRLMMSGLNHEGSTAVGDDFAIDLEVTSNRPDCLGHLGVAREVGVLFGAAFAPPQPTPAQAGAPIAGQMTIGIECPELCYRYTGRVIRGVKIGPSPTWLTNRLSTCGIGSVNNVVDVTNYVMFECAQPLHAFDLSHLTDCQINVREAKADEEFIAIDHRTYRLDRGMCVIADGRRAVALGGVMGGVDSEVSAATVDVLIEAAEFSPVSIRNTARTLNLHSPSSYRFERGIDPQGVDWASRRCAEMILDLAGGELAEGVIDVGCEIPAREPIVLRLDQLERILGIRVSAEEVVRILKELGNQLISQKADQIQLRSPSWRRDLTREIDLVEEVARIHGYDKIPEDVAVPMWPSHQSDQDRVVASTRRTLTANGFDEAITATLVPEQWSDAWSPWTTAAPLGSSAPMKGILADAPKDLGQAETIRRSLIPSLLEARRYNESVSNPSAELFEIAKIYLPAGHDLPHEQWTIGMVSSREFIQLKGVIESLVAAIHGDQAVRTIPWSPSLLDPTCACELRLGEHLLGFMGRLTPAGVQQFGLKNSTLVAELRLQTLTDLAVLIPQYVAPSPYPRVSRDLNLIVQENLSWFELAETVRGSAGSLLSELDYQETYRDPDRDGAGSKRLLFSFTLQADDRTLTNEEADQVRDRIVEACGSAHSAKLLG